METRDYQQQTENIGDFERIVSAAGGAALIGYALWRRSWTSLPAALGGALLLYRGATGDSLMYRMMNITRTEKGVRVERAVTIACPIEEVYSFWRNFRNLPTFMHNLESVEVKGDRESHWVAKGPLGSTIEWDALITAEEPNRSIAWRSQPGSEIESEGRVDFSSAPDGRGTEVFVRLEYRPPLGSAGAAIARLFTEEPDLQVREDLRRFKEMMEAGEIPTVHGQTSGREKVTGSESEERQVGK